MPTHDWHEQGAAERGFKLLGMDFGRDEGSPIGIYANPGASDDHLREQFMAQSGPRYIEPCAPDETSPFAVRLAERCAALGIVVTTQMPEETASAESARLARQDFVATVNRHLP